MAETQTETETRPAPEVKTNEEDVASEQHLPSQSQSPPPQPSPPPPQPSPPPASVDPKAFYGYLYEADKGPTKVFDGLLRAIAQYIVGCIAMLCCARRLPTSRHKGRC